MRQRLAMAGGLGGFLQGIKRAGADIAIDDTEGADGGCGGKRADMARRLQLAYWSLARPHWRRPAQSSGEGGARPVCGETPQISVRIIRSRQPPPKLYATGNREGPQGAS
jgi:hypothetical protein